MCVCILCLVYLQGENLDEGDCSRNIINFFLFSTEDVIYVSFFLAELQYNVQF